MKATVRNLCTEIIKPSSPTPHLLRKTKLSYLDQLQRHVYAPAIFFYEADQSRGLTSSNHSQISQRLKQSLSSTLTLFYPLAGTFEDGAHYVDCNDVGAEFIEAQVDARLVDVIQDPHMEDLCQYTCLDPTDGKVGTPLAVKVTFFECGGISIAVAISHRLADGQSTLAFISAWAATFRGQPDYKPCTFYAPNYFPPMDFPNHFTANSADVRDENLVTRRFIFNEETLMVLKREATSSLVTNPTKVEAVSAFLWMHFIQMAKSKTNSEAASSAAAESYIFPALQIVNLRGRMKPPHSLENVFGNYIVWACALHDANGSVVPNLYHELVTSLRSSTKNINEDYIMNTQGGDSYLNDVHQFFDSQAKGELMGYCTFSSLCGFPIYGIDYGWGSPIWACRIALPAPNGFFLLKTKCGKGIEVWVTVKKDEVEILDAKIRLISANAKRVGCARL